jgi:hypothetical protein
MQPKELQRGRLTAELDCVGASGPAPRASLDIAIGRRSDVCWGLLPLFFGSCGSLGAAPLCAVQIGSGSEMREEKVNKLSSSSPTLSWSFFKASFDFVLFLVKPRSDLDLGKLKRAEKSNGESCWPGMTLAPRRYRRSCSALETRAGAKPGSRPQPCQGG